MEGAAAGFSRVSSLAFVSVYTSPFPDLGRVRVEIGVDNPVGSGVPTLLPQNCGLDDKPTTVLPFLCFGTGSGGNWGRRDPELRGSADLSQRGVVPGVFPEKMDSPASFF